MAIQVQYSETAEMIKMCSTEQLGHRPESHPIVISKDQLLTHQPVNTTTPKKGQCGPILYQK